MVSKVIFCALFAIALGQQQQLPTHGVPATDDGDDGSWSEAKYEAPRSNDIGGRQPQYQQQAQPQPQYQAPAPQQYQAPAPQPQYRPAPQPQQQYRPAPQPQPQYQAPAQQSYQAPAQQSYQAPAQQSYQAPAQQSYQAPAQQSHQAPAQPQYRPQAQKYSQGGDSRNAAILSEARYLQGDGKFGAAYTQEDGVEFKEESDADGTRRGTYSWVDPSGERRTVSYTAGKNGFQASGAHLPVAPAAAAPAAPAAAPQPQYQDQPQYQQPQSQYRQQARAPTSNNYYDVNSNY